MMEIKTGDIVELVTPIRRKELGEGVVIKVRLSGEQTTRVMFTNRGGAIKIYDFSDDKLRVVRVSAGTRLKMHEAVRHCNQLSMELESI